MLRIEELNKSLHDRKAFECGLPEVDTFLQQRARKEANQAINRTWVAIAEETGDLRPCPVVGYYTLTSCTVHHDDISGNYPHYALPALKLAWFGVSREWQRIEYATGTELLTEALLQAWDLFTQTRFGVALLTDPLTAQSERFFRHFGFLGTRRRFRDCETLYLPMKQIHDWIEWDLTQEAGNVLGSPKAAQRWLDQSHQAFEDLTPRQAIDQPGGVDQALRLLQEK